MEFTVPIIVAVLTGIASAVVTAWARDIFDSRKTRRDDKRELIREWRQGIASTPLEPRTAALETPWYDSLRRHLSPEVRDSMEMGYPAHAGVSVAPRPRLATEKVNMRRWKNDLTEAVDVVAMSWGVDR